MTQRPRFRRIEVSGEAAELEAATAVAWEAGATGFEEPDVSETDRDSRSEPVFGSRLIVYTDADVAARVESSLRRWAQRHAPSVEIAAPQPVVEVDWTQRFREHQRVIEVSPRLRVRPPWLPGNSRDVVIEARQAFGTGAHASTGLALVALEEQLTESFGGFSPCVLDIGCGSGVLSIAALRCGASRVFACDLDPQAARETFENAGSNHVADRLFVWCGTLDAFRPPSRRGASGVDLAVANMVRREILLVLPGLAAALRRDAKLLLSGLIETDLSEMSLALAAQAFVVERRLDREEGGDHWVALVTRYTGATSPTARRGLGTAVSESSSQRFLDPAPVASDRRPMIVGVAGPYAAGKSEVVEYLRARDYEAYSLSDVIRDVLAERGESETRERMIESGRALRDRHGPAILAERIAGRFRPAGRYVIDSIRHPAEVDSLRSHGARFLLLWVDAPIPLRFERLRQRDRPGDPRDPGELAAFEARERGGKEPSGQQLAAVEALADAKVWNDGDLDGLRRQVERELERYPS